MTPVLLLVACVSLFQILFCMDVSRPQNLSLDGSDLDQLPNEILERLSIPTSSKFLGSLRTSRLFTNPKVLFDFLPDSKMIKFHIGGPGFDHIDVEERAEVAKFFNLMIHNNKVPKRVLDIMGNETLLTYGPLNNTSELSFGAFDPSEDMLRLIFAYSFNVGSFATFDYDRQMYEAVLNCFYPEEYQFYKKLAAAYEKDLQWLPNLFMAESRVESDETERSMFRKWIVDYLCVWNCKPADPKSILRLLREDKVLDEMRFLDERTLAGLIKFCFKLPDSQAAEVKYARSIMDAALPKLINHLGLEKGDVEKALNGTFSNFPVDCCQEQSHNIFLFISDRRLIIEHYTNAIPACIFDSFSTSGLVDFCVVKRRFPNCSFIDIKRIYFELLRRVASASDESYVKVESLLLSTAFERSTYGGPEGPLNTWADQLAEPLCQFIEGCTDAEWDRVRVNFMDAPVLLEKLEEHLTSEHARVPKLLIELTRNKERFFPLGWETRLASQLAKFVCEKADQKAAIDTFFTDYKRHGWSISGEGRAKIVEKLRNNPDMLYARMLSMYNHELDQPNQEDIKDFYFSGFVFRFSKKARLVDLFKFFKSIRCVARMTPCEFSVFNWEDDGNRPRLFDSLETVHSIGWREFTDRDAAEWNADLDELAR